MSFTDRVRKSLRFVRAAFSAQRDVPPKVSKRQIGEEIPVSWEKDQVLMNYVNRYMLKGAGAGFVTPPYTAIQLPTQNPTYSNNHYAYTSLGYGNILFYHNGNENPNSYLAGRCASLYLVMVQDPNGNYDPKIATDQGLFAEKDIFTYGALFTESDPAKMTGGTAGGGGAVLIGHGFYGTSSFPPCIVLPDSGYPTLNIFTSVANQTYGNLALGSLYINSNGGFIQSSSGTSSWVDFQSPIYLSQTTSTSVSGYGYLNYLGQQGYISGNSGTVGVALQTNGRIFCSGEIDVYSDQRDKNLIDNLSAQTSLKAVMKLNPKHFTWKPETKKGDNVLAGLFAQEVAAAIPEAVTVYGGKRYPDEHTLNYNILTTYALSAIQGLAKEVEEVRSQVQRLIGAGAS